MGVSLDLAPDTTNVDAHIGQTVAVLVADDVPQVVGREDPPGLLGHRGKDPVLGEAQPHRVAVHLRRMDPAVQCQSP